MFSYTVIKDTMHFHHSAYWRGYVSRKSTDDEIRVERVETGKYRGLYRAFLPCWESSTYMLVVYFAPTC